MTLETPAGNSIQIRIMADQGQRGMKMLKGMISGGTGTFAGVPCAVSRDRSTNTFLIPSRKRLVLVRIGGPDLIAVVKALEKAMAPTFAAPAGPVVPPK